MVDEKRNWKRTEILNILMAELKSSPHRLCSITFNRFFSFSAAIKEISPSTNKMNFLSLDGSRMWISAILLLVFVSLGKFVKHDEIRPHRHSAFCFSEKIYVLFLHIREKGGKALIVLHLRLHFSL